MSKLLPCGCKSSLGRILETCKDHRHLFEEIIELNEKYKKAADKGLAMAHVIVEAGIVPGVDYSCRCGECCDQANALDEAGYLDHVKDRWWKEPK